MNKFWKAALTVCGLGGVGAFVFWSLYNKWLSLPGVFERLTSEQTFIVMLVFLGLTFLALAAMLVTYVVTHRSEPRGARNTVTEIPEPPDGLPDKKREAFIRVWRALIDLQEEAEGLWEKN